MKILKIDNKTKEISFICQTIEDLWIIKTISEKGDLIKGSSYRRFKNEETKDSYRKPVFIEIEIEKQDYSSTLNSLRFTGKITFSKPEELAPLGEYHTIEIDFSNKFTLVKKHFFEYQLDLLKNSSVLENKINVVILDDESCEVYLLSGVENKNIASLKSGKHGKRYNQFFDFNNFFEEIASIVIKSKEQLIIAGPGGTKENFSKFLKERYNVSSIVVNLSNTSKSAINELLSKKEILKFFENSIIYKERKLVERFKENVGKNNSLSVYGLKDVSEILNVGACDFILISYSLWFKEIDKIQEIIKLAEKVKTKVHVVDQTHDEINQTVNSFGGIISVLRYKIN
jgi:protein pelota